MGGGEQQRCRLVHAFVRRLRREDDGDEQLEGCAVLQLRGGRGVGLLQALKEFLAVLNVHAPMITRIGR